MSDLKDFLRDLGYFGVGAAAVIVETGSKAVKALVRKGEKTLRDNQETVDDIVRKAKEAGERFKDAVEKATTPAEEEESAADEPAKEGPVAPDAIYRTDEPVPQEEPTVEEPAVEEPIVEEPVAAEIPEDEEKPEETVNG